MPSDYRYDPFNNIAEPIAITGETHIIPSNSPYTIRLKEVPVKDSPSTVSLTIAGVAGVEVAADPAAGEFRCDYTTGADSDDNWNTGLIQFNAADAGKTIIVAYKGMGTLASVNAPLSLPAWAKYRGDGSDGNFVAVGGETLSGVKQYKSFVIGSGLTVNVGTEPLVILCQGDVVIDGTLNGKGNDGSTASSSSAAGGTSVGGSGAGGAAPSGVGSNGSGGGSGGYGKNSGTTVNGGASYFGELLVAASNGNSPSFAYQSLMSISSMLKVGAGGGGGYYYPNAGGGGGGGGGTIILAGETVVNGGTLNVSGGSASTSTGSSANTYSGGGSGGAAIMIIAKSITIAGTITVKGGSGGLARTSGAQAGGSGWYKIFTAG